MSHDPLHEAGMASWGSIGAMGPYGISVEGKHVLDNSGSLPHFGGLTHDHGSSAHSNGMGLKLDLGGDETSHAPSRIAHQGDNSLHDVSKMQVSIGGTVYLGGEIIVTATGAQLNGVPVSSLKPEDFIDGGKFLGRGVSGSVRRMIHRPTGQRIAVKEIALGKSDIAMQNVKRELRTLFVAKQRGTACSPLQALKRGALFLIDSLGAWANEGSVFIAMECMDGSLAMPNQPPCPERVGARIASMVLRGLKFLHEDALLVHRDMKPGNLLIRLDGTVKITDFGLSSQLNPATTQTQSFVGSIMYMSPERVRGEMYSLSSDVWSLGVTIAEIVLGYHPFRDAMGSAFKEGHQSKFWKLVQLFENGCVQLHAELRDLPLSHDFIDFLVECLQADETSRPTCGELLKHHWIIANTKKAAAEVPSPTASDRLTQFQPLEDDDDEDGFSDDEDATADGWKSMDAKEAHAMAQVGTVYGAAAAAAAPPPPTGDEEVAAWVATFIQGTSQSQLSRSTFGSSGGASHYQSSSSSGIHLAPPQRHV